MPRVSETSSQKPLTSKNRAPLCLLVSYAASWIMGGRVSGSLLPRIATVCTRSLRQRRARIDPQRCEARH